MKKMNQNSKRNKNNYGFLNLSDGTLGKRSKYKNKSEQNKNPRNHRVKYKC